MIDILFMLEQIVPNMNPSTGKNKLNVHAAPRRAVPPPYRPAPRQHIFFESLGIVYSTVYTTFLNIKSKSIIKLHFS